MDISFYQMGDLYKKKVLLKEYVDLPGTTPKMDHANSYRTGDSLSGPGNGAANAGNTDPAQFKDRVMFPEDKELSNDTKIGYLINFFKHELNEGTWDEEEMSLFSKFLSELNELRVSKKAEK